MSWKDKDYEVGFGKPPKSGRFEKGKSGNPKGRPKGTRNFDTDLEEALSGKVTVSENGKPRKVSSQHALILRLREKALGGDIRALTLLLALAQQSGANKEALGVEQSLNAAEEDILQRYVADMQKHAAKEGRDGEDPEDG